MAAKNTFEALGGAELIAAVVETLNPPAPSLEFHTLSTASTTRSVTVNILVYYRCASCYLGYGTGKGCEWVLCKDDVSAPLRKNLMTWGLQNINAMSFTFPTTYLSKMTVSWKIPKMTFFFRCVLILLAVKF